MIATSAKLRDIAQAPFIPRCRCPKQEFVYHEDSCEDGRQIRALARLVLTLTGALEDIHPSAEFGKDKGPGQCLACAALAAVEELEL